VAIITLSNIYYKVAVVNHKRIIFNIIFLVICNLGVYGTLLPLFIIPFDDPLYWRISDVNNYALVIVEFLIASLCLLYGFRLYRYMRTVPNPMAALFGATFICFVCFSVKCILILVVQHQHDREYPPRVLLFYFYVSELIPLFVMLIIFETSGKRESIIEMDPSLSLLSHHAGSTPMGTMADERETLLQDSELQQV